MIGQQIKDHLTQLSPEGLRLEPSIEKYEEITLNDEQAAEALRLGREKEFYRLREIEYRNRLSAKPTYPKFNHGQLRAFFEMQYEIDGNNEKIVSELCYYFSGDKAFSGDLGKGLLLAGGVGVGKTSLMQFFSRNQIFSFRLISCRDVEKEFSENGYETIDSFSGNLPISTNGNPFGHQVIGYCFDDLGTESNSKYFGKEKNMMTEVILNRYDRKLPYISTHITTNLTAKDLTEKYGTRVTDRLKEMMNIITFDPTTKSRR
jgi:DNA replication protein DnaC